MMYYGPPYRFYENREEQQQFKDNFKLGNPLTWTTWGKPFALVYFSLWGFITLFGLLQAFMIAYTCSVSPTSNTYNEGRKIINRTFDQFLIDEKKDQLSKIRVDVDTAIHTFKLVNINPPKHMYVDIQDSRGFIYKQLYVAKHCNRMPTLGENYSIQVNSYYLKSDPSKIYLEFKNLSNVFCS